MSAGTQCWKCQRRLRRGATECWIVEGQVVGVCRRCDRARRCPLCGLFKGTEKHADMCADLARLKGRQRADAWSGNIKAVALVALLVLGYGALDRIDMFLHPAPGIAPAGTIEEQREADQAFCEDLAIEPPTPDSNGTFDRSAYANCLLGKGCRFVGPGLEAAR